jgi:integrase
MLQDEALLYLQTYSSVSTVNNAKYALKLLLQSVYVEGKLENLGKRYLQENPDPGQDIQAFFSKIKNRPPASIRVLISHIKTFLIENQFEIPQRFWRRLNRAIKGGNIARTRDRIPTTEELKRILLQMPQHAMTLFLVLTSSGMRIGEALKVKLDDLKLDQDPPRIEILVHYTKTGNPRTAFISNEAKTCVFNG